MEVQWLQNNKNNTEKRNARNKNKILKEMNILNNFLSRTDTVRGRGRSLK